MKPLAAFMSGLLLPCLCAAAFAAPSNAIENERFAVRLQSDSTLAVLDKASGAEWIQCASEGRSVSQIEAKGAELRFRLNGSCGVAATLGESWIDLEIDGGAEAEFAGLLYPGGFVRKDAPGQALLVPNCTGLMVPFSRSREPRLARVAGTYQTMAGQVGLTMPWIGAVDGEAGSLALALTPWDSEFAVEALEGGYAYALRWLPSKGAWAYPRRARFYFADRGGYVRLCKFYREYAREEGLLVSLREKQARAPQTGQLAGALNLWIADPPDIALLAEMKAAGLDKLLVSHHVQPGKFPPEQRNRLGTYIMYESVTRDFADRAHALGVLVGRYDHLFAIMPPRSGPSPSPAGGREDFAAANPFYAPRAFGYPEHLSAARPGAAASGPPAARAGFGGARQGPRFERGGLDSYSNVRCAAKFAELARLYIPLDHQRVGYDARLQDQVCAVNVEECYSEAHPMTRRECVEHRLQALEVPLIVGEMSATEHVAAWAVPFLCYAEAPTSFARFARPTQTIGKVLDAPIPIGEAFWDVALNEQLRVPLWQLAFNDAVVVTNRWNVPPNQYADRAAWEKENLFGILHNQMPTYTLDRAHWNEQRDMIVKSYRQVCEWTGQIAFDEMTSHRFLTEDKKAQRSDFSSGKSVIVNFGDAPYEAEDGRIVPARGFLAIQ